MNKSMKPAGAAPARPMTQEEKQMRIMQFLQQKREQFAINILCSLCHNPDLIRVEDKDAVDLSVEMADKLLEKLYPTNESDDSKETEKSNNN